MAGRPTSCRLTAGDLVIEDEASTQWSVCLLVPSRIAFGLESHPNRSSGV